jgi:hypothetical protein
VWCGVVWCGVVWCGVVWCGATAQRSRYQQVPAGTSRYQQDSSLHHYRQLHVYPLSTHPAPHTNTPLLTHQVAVEESRRLQRFGVTANELERYKVALLRDSDQQAEQANSIPHLENLDFVMEALALGNVVMDHVEANQVGGCAGSRGCSGVGSSGVWAGARGNCSAALSCDTTACCCHATAATCLA